ncbi:hypothetical protein D3C86_1596640 [compost metagenome]
MTDAADQLAAVAPAGAPADLVRLQQRYREAFLRQFDGRVQPGKAAADDAHIDAEFSAQGRVGQLPVDAGGVIGGGVLGAVDRLVNAGVHVLNPDYYVWKFLRRISAGFACRQGGGAKKRIPVGWSGRSAAIGRRRG